MSDKEVIEERIRSFYRTAGLTWKGCINDQVAAVFHEMLREAAKCSNAMDFVPRPPGGKASVTWLAMQIGKIGFNQFQDNLYEACVRRAVLNFKTPMMMACIL